LGNDPRSGGERYWYSRAQPSLKIPESERQIQSLPQRQIAVIEFPSANLFPLEAL
jgi:hypothetical protein